MRLKLKVKDDFVALMTEHGEIIEGVTCVHYECSGRDNKGMLSFEIFADCIDIDHEGKVKSVSAQAGPHGNTIMVEVEGKRKHGGIWI